MLEQARGFARRQSIDNVEWRAGDVYQTPFADGSFNIVTCRFAFHHFEKPALAFAEMVRLAATRGRVVVCDGLASEEPAKAEAFNAMERRRDPSTVEFRTLPYLASSLRGCRSRRPPGKALRPSLSRVRPCRALVSG
jgi:ubiquinone/menaquinone biosynthesis C-methylase UbiE